MISPESANIVCVGHFNPYLISPEWLRKEGIWEPEDVHLQLEGLVQDSVRFKGGDVEWTCSFKRMSISSATVNCGTLAEQVLNRLRHTPVFATGANFTFQAPEITLDNPHVRKIIDSPLVAFPEPDLLKWSVLRHDGDVRIEVTFICGEQGGSVAVNRHRKTESAESAMSAFLSFDSDKLDSCKFAENWLAGMQPC